MNGQHYLIVMSGPAASGKTYCANIIEQSHDDCVIISKNDIRHSLLGDTEEYFAHEDEVENMFFGQLSKALTEHKYVIADDLNLTRISRLKLFNNLYTLPSIKNLKKIAVWMDCGAETALQNNEHRSGRDYVFPKVIEGMYKRKMLPEANEGFDEIIIVSQELNKAISANDPGFSTIEDRLQQI